MHKHPAYEVVYYCSGRGHTIIDGIRYEYSPGDFAVITRGTAHDEARKEDTRVIYLGFFNYNDSIRLSTGMYRDEQEVVLRILLKISEEIANKRKHFIHKLNVLLQWVLIEISRMHEIVLVQDDNETLLRTIHYMQQYYTESVNITQLANMSGYSYDRFRHLFKEYVGMTPMNYISHLRLEKAKELLSDNTVSIMEIAMLCGFSSYSRFNETFRKEIGKSPRQYMDEANTAKRLGKWKVIHRE
ncbi:MAG: AraC family transcriptional regulator, partial [Paenibacillus sp.]|nr:AraC family transcriptional regulator [Paenibacillus sp.]